MFGFLKKLFGGSSVDLGEVMAKKPYLVDVRTPMEYNQGHPKGSVNIPLNTVGSNIKKFKGKEHIVVFCQSGNRSGQAASILRSNGIENVVNGGSWRNVARYTGH